MSDERYEAFMRSANRTIVAAKIACALAVATIIFAILNAALDLT